MSCARCSCVDFGRSYRQTFAFSLRQQTKATHIYILTAFLDFWFFFFFPAKVKLIKLQDSPTSVLMQNTSSSVTMAICRAGTTEWIKVEPGTSNILKTNDCLALKWTTVAGYIYRVEAVKAAAAK